MIEPIDKTTAATSAAVIADQVGTLTVTGDNYVLNTREFTFDFTLDQDLADTDYFIIKFPDNYFDITSDLLSSVSINTGFTFKILKETFELYIQPTSSQTSGAALSVIISDLPSPPHTLLNDDEIFGYLQ